MGTVAMVVLRIQFALLVVRVAHSAQREVQRKAGEDGSFHQLPSLFSDETDRRITWYYLGNIELCYGNFVWPHPFCARIS